MKKLTVMNKSLATCSAIFFAFALSSCSGSGGEEATPVSATKTGSYSVQTVKGAVLIRDTQDEAGMQALVTGTLSQNDTGCFGITDELGEHHATVWPAGTELNADGTGVTLADGSKLAIGDALEGGGGYLSADEFSEADGFPQQCKEGADEEIIVSSEITAIQ